MKKSSCLLEDRLLNGNGNEACRVTEENGRILVENSHLYSIDPKKLNDLLEMMEAGK